MKQALIHFYEKRQHFFERKAANHNHSFIRYFLESGQKYNVLQKMKNYLEVTDIGENDENINKDSQYFFSSAAKKESQQWMNAFAAKNFQ